MSGLAAEINGPMVVVRALHFVAAATIAGALVFRAFVADPALGSEKELCRLVDSRIRRVVWIGLILALTSGAVWLLLQSAAMSGQRYEEALASGTPLTVLEETQFGFVSAIRLGLATLLAICLVFDRRSLARWSALVAALGLVAAIAWTGHAGSTPSELGYVHLAADALHLATAAVWTGGLVSLVLLLHATRRLAAASTAPELDAVKRFSTLGVISVATLVGSGAVNAWILVGSWRGLFVTEYGWVLMAKLAILATMLVLVGINRFWLTPLMASPASAAAVRGLTRNATAEIGLVLLIFALVGLLGTLHPAAHLVH